MNRKIGWEGEGSKHVNQFQKKAQKGRYLQENVQKGRENNCDLVIIWLDDTL